MRKQTFHRTYILEKDVSHAKVEVSVHRAWFLDNDARRIEPAWVLRGAIAGLGFGEYPLYHIDQWYKNGRYDASSQVLDGKLRSVEGISRQLSILLRVSDVSIRGILFLWLYTNDWYLCP